MFSGADSDVEKEARRFDRRSKRKSPEVIEISDDEKRANAKGRQGAKKTLKVNKKTAKIVKKETKSPKQDIEVDFTINLSPDLKRSRTIIPVQSSKPLELHPVPSK